MRLRVRAPTGTSHRELDGADTTCAQLYEMLALELSQPVSAIMLRFGVPPALLPYTHDRTLVQAGIEDEDTLFVDTASLTGSAAPKPATTPAAPPPPTTTTTTASQPPQERRVPKVAERLIRRHVIPGDNSCLFNAIGYALEERSMTKANEMRSTVAAIITSDPATYNEAVLGRPPEEYVEWIMTPSHWGGAIEVSILSKVYETELCVFEVTSEHVDFFGEDAQYPRRALLLYDGLHYDLLVEVDSPSAPASEEKTVFPRSDTRIVQLAREFMHQRHVEHKYTDTANFKLKCLVCQAGLRGDQDAVRHAQATGHQNFSEYS